MMEIQPVITAAQVKEWCRIDNDDDDLTIALLIAAAQEAATSYTGLALHPDTCPASIKQAIAVRVADLYANREGQIVGDAAFRSLLNPHRVSLL